MSSTRELVKERLRQFSTSQPGALPATSARQYELLVGFCIELVQAAQAGRFDEEPPATVLDPEKEQLPIRSFEVWIEGCDRGDGADNIPATLLGHSAGTDFADAADHLIKKLRRTAARPELMHYDPDRLILNGRKLFSNEKDARKSWG